MMDSFPDSVSDADIAQLLEPVALLDEKIEEQIGCRIVEVGEVIPVPDGAPQGWNEDEQRYRRTCPVLADEGQILGFYLDDENHGSPKAPGQANSSCGTFSYLRPVLEIWPCPGCEVDALAACGESTPHGPRNVPRAESGGLCACGALPPQVGGANRCAIHSTVFRGEGKPLPTPHPRGAARREWMPSEFHHRLLTLHELLHILGFVHYGDHDKLDQGGGVPMSPPLTWSI